MKTRMIPVALAAVLLVGVVIPTFASPAQATLTDAVTQTVDGQCEPGAILTFVQCEVAPIVAEGGYVVTVEQGVAAQAEAYTLTTGGQVVAASTTFASTGEAVTTAFVANAQAGLGAVIVYADGQPVIVASFSLSALNGECGFWTGGPCVDAPPCACGPQESSPAPLAMSCLGGEVGVIECTVLDISLTIADHYLDASNTGVWFAEAESAAGQAAAGASASAEQVAATTFEHGVDGAAKTYVVAVRGATNGASDEGAAVLNAQCALVTGNPCFLTTP